MSDKKIKQGFTLIEVLIAIFVLVIGIFGVMALFPVGIHQTAKIATMTTGAISAEIPLAYALYKYPAGNTGGPDNDIQDIVSTISGTTTPMCYIFPASGTVTISGHYGWNMSLVPVDMDGNGTATSVSETFLFREQIAVYKNYKVATGTANFSYNSTAITNVSNINNISINKYICNAQNNIWYRVTGVNAPSNSITIKQSYEYGTVTSATYMVTDTVVGLYNTLLTPH
ncbi:MAG: prepilin-type N-terminal cleavage/methylation domain-containing protein [Candidatus Brocadiaceae bacterium]